MSKPKFMPEPWEIMYNNCCELDYVLGEWEAGKCSDTDFEIGVVALIKDLRPILAQIDGGE